MFKQNKPSTSNARHLTTKNSIEQVHNHNINHKSYYND